MSYIDALDGQIELMAYFGTGAGKRAGERLINGRSLSKHMQMNLAWAETYFVGPDICDLLRSVSETLPENAAINRADLPTQAGFVWMERPSKVSLPSIRGNRTVLQAYSWHLWDSDDSEGVLLLLYEREENFSWPGVVGAIFLPFGALLSDVRVIASTEEESDIRDGESFYRWHYSLLAFMRDSILRSDATRPLRAARRRVPPEFRPAPLIRVVQLRRAHYLEHPTDEATVNWSHRWLVGGHWRQQWYPSLQKHQPKWIAPYVKGPDGKPVKAPRATVFAVTR